jgi:superfamily II DNA or RNA helicase
MLEGVINSNGLYISYSDFLNKCGSMQNVKKILKTLTIVEKICTKKPKGSPLIIRHAYIIENNILIIPKIKADIFLKHNLIDNININYDFSYNRSFDTTQITIPLYDYQEEILRYLINRYNSSETYNKICYLQMDTGLGKTRIGCALINSYGYTGLVIVPTIAIGMQWIDECNEIYPNLTTSFYKNSGKNKDAIITVIVINTFVKKDYNFVKEYGIIIYDEAHELHTPCFSKALWLTHSGIILGLSATPLERPDMLDRYVTLHLGLPIKATDLISIKIPNFKGEVKCIQYYGDIKYVDPILTSTGIMSTILTIGSIIQDKCRIDLIVSEILKLYNKNKGVFVFAEHRVFLDVIKTNLLNTNILPIDNIIIDDTEPFNVSILKGGIKYQELNDVKKYGSLIVLTTYGYSRRGISLPNMYSLILSTPRRNGLKQIIGRILRKGSDESVVREVIDIVDMRSNLKSQYYDRKKIYIEKGYPIYESKVKADDNLDKSSTLTESSTLDEDPALNSNNILNIIKDLYS